MELDGGEFFTAPIDDWSREFANACVSTNSVVRNAMAANRRVARNADDTYEGLKQNASKMVSLIKKPYHSWERGTNENRNGVVRKVLPKGSRFDAITDEEMRRIDRMLNDRPLRCLGWRTPREVFMSRLQYRLSAV